MDLEILDENAMKDFGAACGRIVRGGEIFELIGDIGAGKTTFTKGLASGMEIDDDVQSPTFTISRVYAACNGLRLVHYDFYRLSDAGILKEELQEALGDDQAVVVIEWSGAVAGVLPEDRLRIAINPKPDTGRTLRMIAGGEKSVRVLEGVR